MRDDPRRLDLDEVDANRERLLAVGLVEPAYGGPLSRHLHEGDERLRHLRYDDSAAALRLWNFLLTEEERLCRRREEGWTLVGTMKDLGTTPLLAYALPRTLAFYPDGAWWIPCVMELSAGLLHFADDLGLDEGFCPVRAMVGAFMAAGHFPSPDLVTCSVGATCDDFSAIAQRLQGLGVPILWWEMPHVRSPEEGEDAVILPSGARAPADALALVVEEFRRIGNHLRDLVGVTLDENRLRQAIRVANRVRAILRELRRLSFTAGRSPLPALELLIAEMLAIHYCSDRDECELVLSDLLAEVRTRVAGGRGHGGADAVKVFWVNPVADLAAIQLVEDCGARLCGTDFMFAHALDAIPEDRDPWEALGLMALDDPLAGDLRRRAGRIVADVERFGAEAVIISRIPGASHCAWEGEAIAAALRRRLRLPCVELEVPPLSDGVRPTLRTRIEAMLEMVRVER